jgi:pimeloyl-ACP methyl ester carboxylesterase
MKHYPLATFIEGNGKPVVLLHGQISTHNYMQPLVELLVPHKYEVISLDLLGFGNSPRPSDCAYSIDDHVASIVYTLKVKNIARPFILVGHSMGALIAVRLAKKHPELVDGLILSALPVMPLGKEYQHLAKEFPGTRSLLRGQRAKLMHRFFETHEATAQKLVVRLSKRRYGNLPEHIRADIVRHSWEAYDRSLRQALAYDVFDDLVALDIKVTLCYGENDHISKGLVGKSKQLQKATVTVVPVPGARHNLLFERPDVVAKAVLSV